MGDQTLQISDLHFNLPEFTYTAPSVPFQILSTDTLQLTAYFYPTQVGTYVDTLKITNNDVTNPISKISFQGTGTFSEYNYGYMFWQYQVPPHGTSSTDPRVEGWKVGTFTVADADAIGEVAKMIAAVGGVVGGVWAVVYRIVRRWKKRQEVGGLEAKAIRYLLDAQRHTLYFVTPSRMSRHVTPDELDRQKVLIDGVRDELWVMDGHESERERQRMTEDVVSVLPRTQAIQVKKSRETSKEDEVSLSGDGE